MYLNYSLKLQIKYIKIYKFIKLNIEHIIIMIEAQNCDFLTYILSELSARFQLENYSAPAWLGLAWNFHSSGSLEPKNSSSYSSLANSKDSLEVIYKHNIISFRNDSNPFWGLILDIELIFQMQKVSNM